MAPPKLKVVQAAEPEDEIALLPEHVVVGPYQYSIREVGELERIKADIMGFCDEGGLEIGVAVEGVTPQHQAEVMIHEILHALFGAGSLRDNPDVHEEQIVTVLAKGLIQVARDNPHILRWINDQYPVIRSA
jgi:hypothetical protein